MYFRDLKIYEGLRFWNIWNKNILYLKNVSQFSRKKYNQNYKYSVVVVVLSLSHVQLLQPTPWTVAQCSLNELRVNLGYFF